MAARRTPACLKLLFRLRARLVVFVELLLVIQLLGGTVLLQRTRALAPRGRQPLREGERPDGALRGVNVSYLESVAVQGWDPSDPGGGGKPQWPALLASKVNAVRFPLNEASWLDYSCADATGATRDPDPGKNYRQTVEQTVQEANAAALYVILDLHLERTRQLLPAGPETDGGCRSLRRLLDLHRRHV